MFTITAGAILPCTVTGSWPRPHWFDQSMWGRPLDTCMMDVRFREKFQDALATVLSDQERAGLDIITDGEMRRESYSNRFATALEGINPADAHRLLAQLEAIKENVRNAIQNSPAEPPKKEQRYG